MSSSYTPDISIPKKKDSITFNYLKERGMALIQELAGDVWTDHNAHDPGITILEQLCYALTDLVYRTDFDMADLLHKPKQTEWGAGFLPFEMLSTGPVTLNDWRKVIIDTEGVRNGWIEKMDTRSELYDAPVFFNEVEETLQPTPNIINRDALQSQQPVSLQGLYEVSFIAQQGFSEDEVQARLKKKLIGMRNLGEDFHLVYAIQSQSIIVSGEVEIEDFVDPVFLLADIYFKVHEYLNPAIQFHNWEDQLQKGYSIESLLDGPQLNHGYLDNEQLAAFQLRKSIRISDIIRLIMSIKGVRSVKLIAITSETDDQTATTDIGARKSWEYLMPEGVAPKLFIPGREQETATTIRLVRDGLPIYVQWQEVWDILQSLLLDALVASRPKVQDKSVLVTSLGTDRSISEYQSIQHHFPDIYGIGSEGLPKEVTPKRQMQMLQLKAYLSLFDQLLANAFSQLGGVNQLFSFGETGSEKTYFSQDLFGEVPDFQKIVNFEKTTIISSATDTDPLMAYKNWIDRLTRGSASNQTASITNHRIKDRKERLLNHLLARYQEQIISYDKFMGENLITTKVSLLNEYSTISYNRGKAFDYLSPFGEGNLPGLQRRVSLLLGFDTHKVFQIHLLEENDRGAFHLIEHILLRPSVEDLRQPGPLVKITSINEEDNSIDSNTNEGTPSENSSSEETTNLDFELSDTSQLGDIPEFREVPPEKDPYSLQVSYLFPDWLKRFDEKINPGFRKIIVRTLREETPAHLKMYVYWLSKEDMEAFEQKYANWLDQFKNL